MNPLFILVVAGLVAGCASTAPQPVAQARQPFLTSMLTSSDADSPATDDPSPHEFHTTYYDKEGSTHDVLTEVDVEGNQKVIEDIILVYGSGHED